MVINTCALKFYVILYLFVHVVSLKHAIITIHNVWFTLVVIMTFIILYYIINYYYVYLNNYYCSGINGVVQVGILFLNLSKFT